MRHYLLTLLVAVAVVSYIDRQILAVVLEPVRRDLGLSDTSMGLLTGAFFSLAYAIAGVPLARLADTGNRRSLIAVCIGGWSVATACCGFAQSFAQLALARMSVAIGEAGSAPASYSLLSDSYPERQRARVFALISGGSAVGLAFGVFLAGSLSELLGWRRVFLVLAIPGVVVALLLRLTVREPARFSINAAKQPTSMAATLASLFRIPTYRWLILIAVSASTTTFAVLGWMPTFLIRAHGFSHAELGVKMGGAIASGLLLGNLCSGALADQLRHRDIRWLIWVAGGGLLACVPTGLLCFFAPSGSLAIGFLALYMFFMGSWTPILATIAVGVVHGHARALAVSLMPIMQSIGGAIGPFFVGWANDHLFGNDPVGIRLSLAMSLAGCVIAGGASLIAGGALRRDYLPTR